MNRRKFITGCAAVGGAALAGCTGELSSGPRYDSSIDPYPPASRLTEATGNNYQRMEPEDWDFDHGYVTEGGDLLLVDATIAEDADTAQQGIENATTEGRVIDENVDIGDDAVLSEQEGLPVLVVRDSNIVTIVAAFWFAGLSVEGAADVAIDAGEAMVDYWREQA